MEVVSFLVNRPEIQLLSKGIKINEGSKELDSNIVNRYNNSNKYYDKSSLLIPLASQTFQKPYAVAKRCLSSFY